MYNTSVSNEFNTALAAIESDLSTIVAVSLKSSPKLIKNLSRNECATRIEIMMGRLVTAFIREVDNNNESRAFSAIADSVSMRVANVVTQSAHNRIAKREAAKTHHPAGAAKCEHLDAYFETRELLLQALTQINPTTTRGNDIASRIADTMTPAEMEHVARLLMEEIAEAE